MSSVSNGLIIDAGDHVSNVQPASPRNALMLHTTHLQNVRRVVPRAQCSVCLYAVSPARIPSREVVGVPVPLIPVDGCDNRKETFLFSFISCDAHVCVQAVSEYWFMYFRKSVRLAMVANLDSYDEEAQSMPQRPLLHNLLLRRLGDIFCGHTITFTLPRESAMFLTVNVHGP